MQQIYEEEKKYLEKVNELIKKEIEYTENKHKEVSEMRLSFEDRKRGMHFINNARLNMLYFKLEKLKSIVSSPYFGRMDFTEKNTDKLEKLYIGKTTVTDDDNKLHVIDWRSPISNMYYDNTIGPASYVAPDGIISGNISLKRQIIISNAELEKVLDVDLVGNDAILQEYLGVHADNRMKDIVASIQQEQNKIIRHGSRDDIIVQGIAGSGKTSVALHRIAYLMYLLSNNNSSNKIITPEQFMIIGPNAFFLNYISTVLPDLDVGNAKQLTLVDLVGILLNEKITINNQSNELQEYLKEGNISEESQIKTSPEFELALEKYIEELHNYCSSTPIEFNDVVIFDEQFMNSRFNDQNTKLVDRAIKLEKVLIDKIKKDVRSEYDTYDEMLTKDIFQKIKTLPKDSETRKLLFDKLDLIRAELKTGLSKTIKSHFSPINISLLKHYKNFITNLEKYIDFDNIDNFKTSTLKRITKKNLSRDDIGPLLLLKEKLSSVSEYKDTIHVVIDEAQDLSLLEFKTLKELFPNATFSIFGDLNQSIFSYRSIENWNLLQNKVFDGKCTVFELNQSYRTTDEIMKEANKVSKYITGNVSENVVRHGDTVDYLHLDNNEIINSLKEFITKFMKKGYKSLGIITKTETEAKKINDQLKSIGIDIVNVTSDDKEYRGGICTIASSLSKGLEFDATILVNVNDNVYDIDKDVDMKLLYVAMTRALHKMVIIYSDKLPSVLSNKEIKKTLQKEEI